MNRSAQPRNRGRRDIIAIILLVLPLVAIGYYLAAIEVAVDPPPDPLGESTPAVVTTSNGTPDDAPVTAASPSSGDPSATPIPGASRMTPTGQRHGIETMPDTVIASRM